MRGIFQYAASAVLFAFAAGCASMSQPTARVDIDAGTTPLPPYSGPKARIAIAEFEIKAAKAHRSIGTGLREMLITSLVNSNRFSVMERQALQAAMQEQELAASGAASPGGVKRGAIKTADLIVTAAVTEFEPRSVGGGSAVGAGGSIGSVILGGIIAGSMNKAHMALDIRVIDASTSKILSATRVQGKASDFAGGFGVAIFGEGALGTGLSGYAKTPMEKAIRVCIIEAVKYIAQTVPANYFKY
ncbi:MAG TPA: CsgG/HfaB family protein [Candidatus Omnitrophota bacterium]|nr:CsgG/HfaB family protein [Candidatus Omnitrophota bacterium]